jgi:triacylglycerol esterase/lipase EstA (alpha/beta hydrolase family)
MNTSSVSSSHIIQETSIFSRVISHTIGVISDLATVVLAAPLVGIAALYKSNFDPLPKDIKTDTTPILLIHGNGFNEIQWALARYFLSGSEYGSVFTLNLDGLLTNQSHLGIDDYAKLVQIKIEDIKKKTGRDDIIMSGHSMGGLVAAYYAEYLAKPEEVKGVISISTPWKKSALLGFTTHITKKCFPSLFENPKRYRQMRDENNFVTELLARMSKKSYYYSMFSEGDEMVSGSSGRLEGLPKERVRKFSWLGHYSPMVSPAVWNTMQRWIKASHTL